jgi:flagellar hook-associated protein 2
MPVVDGIASGINTTELINAIVSSSAGSKRALENQLVNLNGQKSGVSGFKTRLQSVLDSIKSMDETDEFPEYNINLSSDSSFTATVDSTASPGTFDVEISALAKAESWATGGVSDKDASGAVSEGTYSITVAGTATNVTIDSANSSLAGVAGALNDLSGVTAYVLDTGAASNKYKLMVSSDATGAANTIDLSAISDLTFSKTVTASDAAFTINGVSVLSTTNTVEDPIPGVDLNLTAVTSSAVNAVVSRDSTKMSDKMSNFVDKFNDVINFYNTSTGWDPGQGTKGTLTGDSIVRSIVSKMGMMVSTQYDLGGKVTSLAELGVSTTRSGALSYDSSDFGDSLGDYYSDVVELITSDSGPLGKIRDQLEDVYLDSFDGTLKSRTDSLEDSIEDLEDQISDFEKRLTSYSDRLRDQFTNMEVVLGELNSTQAFLSQLFQSNSS